MATPLNTIGLSFAPTGQNQANQQQGADGSNLSPVQQAIKILSLRVPRNAGPGGIAPNALLTGPGSAGLGGMGGGMDLMSLLRRLLQPGAQGAGATAGMGGIGAGPGMGASSIPAPLVTPGETDKRPLPGTETGPPTAPPPPDVPMKNGMSMPTPTPFTRPPGGFRQRMG